MKYSIHFAPAAYRDLKKLPTEVKRRIDEKILALSEEPLPPGVAKLSGRDDFYRIRVGDFRIIYPLKNKDLLILVIRIRHRREVYRP